MLAIITLNNDSKQMPTLRYLWPMSTLEDLWPQKNYNYESADNVINIGRLATGENM